MCNRYQNRASAAEIARLFRADLPHGMNYAEEVFPGYPGMVVAEGRARVMAWGFPHRLPGMKPTSKPKAVNNARNDKLQGPFWRDSFAKRRCLIPATAWAEAQGPKGKMTCTWHSLPGREAFALAGIWRPTDEWGDAYSMVMVDSCRQMAEIHDRMPVILEPEQFDQWTQGTPAEAFDLVQTWCGHLTVAQSDQPWGKAEAPRLL